MSIKKMAWFAVLASVLGVVSPVAASPNGEQACVFDRYAAVSVAPYHQDEDYGLGTYSQLRGAQVFVEAQPGLTAEWLNLSVQRGLAEMQCGPNLKDVRVSVMSAGAGFWVTLSASDDGAAKALLSWAKGIVPAAK